MRIAFVTVRIPYPLNAGGRIRSFHLLKQLTCTRRVTLVTAIESDEEARAAVVLQDKIPGLVLRAVRVPRRNAPIRAAARVLGNAFDPLPYTWAGYRHRRFLENLARALHDDAYDLVHCDHVQVAHALLPLQTPPRVLNAHNVDSVLVGRLADVETRPLRRMLLRWQAEKVGRAEMRTYPHFDAALAMSDVDREQLLRIAPGLPVWTVPNGVDLEWFAPTRERPDPNLLVFPGAMDWPPNGDAVNFFARSVLPLIRRRRPQVQLLVVGRNPPPALVSFGSVSGVSFTGTVPDVRAHLARAALVVVPLRVGSGTRLKILEAWAMAKPVVSTHLGAEGLPARDGENISLGGTAEELAARVLDLLDNPRRAADQGTGGRRTVEEQFSWRRVADTLLSAYDAILQTARARQRSTRGRHPLTAP